MTPVIYIDTQGSSAKLNTNVYKFIISRSVSLVPEFSTELAYDYSDDGPTFGRFLYID